MQSHAEPRSINTRRRGARDAFATWNRKGHYYLGLYFLFFLWLFAFTGLLLNHSWGFADFWPKRTVSKFERQVQVPTVTHDLERAREIMRQLGIQGEIEWTAGRTDGMLFFFRVARPGRTSQVTVDAQSNRATVEQTDINAWGIVRVLHTFTGVRSGDERNSRDWVLTTVWAFSMDAVAVALVLMVFSGLYLWMGQPTKRRVGAAALLAGTITCAMFVFGLRLIC